MINFVWSTVFVREREEGNPWQSRGLEWQIASPPPPGNFDQVPVVLSGPYEYGIQDAQPVADLYPPAGVLTAAFSAVTAESGQTSGGIDMAETTTPPPAGLSPGRGGGSLLPRGGAERDVDRVRGWPIGGLSFVFGAFVFAFFYLRSLNSHGLWYPKR